MKLKNARFDNFQFIIGNFLRCPILQSVSYGFALMYRLVEFYEFETSSQNMTFECTYSDLASAMGIQSSLPSLYRQSTSILPSRLVLCLTTSCSDSCSMFSLTHLTNFVGRIPFFSRQLSSRYLRSSSGGVAYFSRTSSVDHQTLSCFF